MAKCKRCGKKGFFLKVDEYTGLCSDCLRIDRIESDTIVAKQHLTMIQKEISNILDYKEQIKKEAISEIESKISNLEYIRKNKEVEVLNLRREVEQSNKTLLSNSKKVLKLKEVYNSIKYYVDNFYKNSYYITAMQDPKIHLIEKNLSPTVKLNLHCLDLKELRTLYKQNEKQIHELHENYKNQYYSKANETIYKLMVIALEAEIQNILYNLNYGKLEKAIEDVKKVTTKYLNIAFEGNQTFKNTTIKFIGQIEYYFIEAVKIEYEYYTKKERIKEEQRALREQMKQEAEERKRLEEQQKQIEKEESKYKLEIDNLKALLQDATDEKEIQINERIQQLETQLNEVNLKKEEITKLQNGKAGYVYIISNLGSFGDNMFKIGMTRRLEPQERIDELGSASVPFPFDVHSFIFSNDAVGLENNLHRMLHEKRTNKINMRKEFFTVSIDELEKLVTDMEPTCEFKRTMLAEQYNQSISIGNSYQFDDDILESNNSIDDDYIEEVI